MSRQTIRDLKRTVRNGSGSGAAGEGHVLAKEAALALLARSVDFGHPRLAIIRLAMAVEAGADVPASHWEYCRTTAAGTKDISLRAMFDAACSTLHPLMTH